MSALVIFADGFALGALVFAWERARRRRARDARLAAMWHVDRLDQARDRTR